MAHAITAIRSWPLIRVIAPAPIESSKKYREARKFKENVEPKPKHDYSWVLAYAQGHFDRIEAVGKTLDEKANDIIKYLGGGTGLLTLAAVLNVTPANVAILLCAIPAFVLALCSIFFAVLARKPSDTFIPPGVESAFQYADYYEAPAEAQCAFIGQWHMAGVGTSLAYAIKADRVAAATWLFFAGIVSLSLPIGAAAYFTIVPH